MRQPAGAASQRKPPSRLAATLAKATSLWALICVLAVGNGALRDAVLAPVLGTTAALVASGLLLAVVVLAVACLGAAWYGPQSKGVLIGIGGYWLVLTVLFETGFGWLVLQRSGDELLGQYSPAGGNLWLLVLATIAVAPCSVPSRKFLLTLRAAAARSQGGGAQAWLGHVKRRQRRERAAAARPQGGLQRRQRGVAPPRRSTGYAVVGAPCAGAAAGLRARRNLRDGTLAGRCSLCHPAPRRRSTRVESPDEA